MDVFPRVVWMLSQLTAFALKLQQKNLHGQKSTVWTTVLIPQNLLTRMLSIIFSCEFFSLFSANLVVVSIIQTLMVERHYTLKVRKLDQERKKSEFSSL